MIEVEAPCVLYVPLTPDSEHAVGSGRLRSLVRNVEREDWAGGKSWLRLEAHHRHRWDLAGAVKQEGLVPHEADVSPARRLLSEHDGVKIARRETVDVFLDVECDPTVPFHLHAEGRAPILSISWAVGIDGPVHTLFLPKLEDRAAWERAERDMLEEFQRRLIRAGAHLLAAWNGRRYDQPVVLERSAALGIPRESWDRWIWLDLLGCYRAHFQRGETGEQRVSFALDAMAHALVGERKLDLRLELEARGIPTDPRSPSQVRVAYDSAPDLLRYYNAHDVHLMQALERRKHFLDLQKACASLCRTPPDDRSLFKSALCDGIMIRVGRKTGVHFRTKPTVEERLEMDQDQAEGALILESAPPGVYEDVAMLDFAGMYPTLIECGNISPDTRLEDGEDAPHCTTPNGGRFRTDVMGIFPLVLRQLGKRRAEAKARAKAAKDGAEQVDLAHESDSLKIIRNSFYGLLLGQFSRYYDKVCGEAVTTSAQECMKILCGSIARAGGTVLMGDTDASGAQVPVKLRLACGKAPGCWHVDVSEPVRLCNEWARSRGWPRATLEIEHETTFRKFMIAKRRGDGKKVESAKKRYAGTATYYKGAHLDHPKLEVKGLEVMRSDGAMIMRRLLGDVLAAALLADASTAELRGLVDLARVPVLAGQAGVDDLVVRQNVTKPLAEYERPRARAESPTGALDLDDAEEVPAGTSRGLPPHVVVAKRLVEAGWPVYEGTKVEYVATRRDGAGKLVALHPTEWDGAYDADFVWDERVWEPTRQVLEVLHPGVDWTALDARGSSLTQGDLFAAPKPPPPDAPRGRGSLPDPESIAGVVGDVVVVEVGPKASRGDVVRLRLAVGRCPGTAAVRLAVAGDGAADVDLRGWGVNRAGLAAALTWTDQVRVRSDMVPADGERR